MKTVAIIGTPALHKNYKAALENAGCKAVIFPDSSYVKKHAEVYDGLLLPGGGDVFSSLSEYKALPKNTLSRCKEREGRAGRFDDFHLTLEQLLALHLFYEQKKPVFGICKGMQLINLYFQGTIKEVSNRNCHRRAGSDTLHPADNLPGGFLHALFGPHMLVNSNHHQCIDSSGQNLQVIQHAADKTAEAISHLSAPIFGTQWHPERMPALSRQDTSLLFRYFVSFL